MTDVKIVQKTAVAHLAEVPEFISVRRYEPDSAERRAKGRWIEGSDRVATKFTGLQHLLIQLSRLCPIISSAYSFEITVLHVFVFPPEPPFGLHPAQYQPHDRNDFDQSSSN